MGCRFVVQSFRGCGWRHEDTQVLAAGMPLRARQEIHGPVPVMPKQARHLRGTTSPLPPGGSGSDMYIQPVQYCKATCGHDMQPRVRQSCRRIPLFNLCPLRDLLMLIERGLVDRYRNHAYNSGDRQIDSVRTGDTLPSARRIPLASADSSNHTGVNLYARQCNREWR